MRRIHFLGFVDIWTLGFTFLGVFVSSLLRDTERQRGGEQDQGGQAEQRNHPAHLLDHCP